MEGTIQLQAIVDARGLSFPNLRSLEVAPGVPCLKALFAFGWEAQSYLATVSYVGLVAAFSVWHAILVMLAWSLTATFVCSFARRRGFPDLLARHDSQRRTRRPDVRIRSHLWFVVRVWLAGLQAFVFSRASRRLLTGRRRARNRLVRVGLLGVGLTLFGVTTAEHLLRRAGYRGDQLLRLCLIGPFLNVPYRTFLSAAVTHAVWSTARFIF